MHWILIQSIGHGRSLSQGLILSELISCLALNEFMRYRSGELGTDMILRHSDPLSGGCANSQMWIIEDKLALPVVLSG